MEKSLEDGEETRDDARKKIAAGGRGDREDSNSLRDRENERKFRNKRSCK